jgi:tetratricopeptide (TPR) repeat protein
MSGEPRTPPADRRVPAGLRRIVLRGLSPQREQRWPSMLALAGALAKLLRGSRGRVIASGIVAVGLAGAVWIARQRGESCDSETELAKVWNDGTRTQLRDAIANLSLAAVEDLAPRVDARIDAWSAEWIAAQQRICERPAGWSDALRDRANVCTTRALAALSATLHTISNVQLTRASQVLDLADRLPPLAPCESADVLLADVAPPTDPQTIAEVAAVHAELADLRARRNAGEGKRVLADVEATVTHARAIGYAPLVAETLLEHGLALGDAGNYGPDAAVLEEAFYAATAAGDQQVALEAAIGLLGAGGDSSRPKDALAWGRHAHALAAALPKDPLIDARMDATIAALHVQLAELDEAEPLLTRALAAYEEAHRERDAALILAELGQLQIRRGDLDGATRWLELARDRTLAVLGPYHPDSARPLVGLGTIAMRRDDFDGAARVMGEALTIYEGALGPDHPHVAGCLHNLGSIERARGNLPAARELLLRALAQRERTLGPDHPDVAATLGLLGSVDEGLGDLALARSRYERALRIFVASYGEDHPRVADVLNNVGTVAIDERDYDGAIAALDRALAIRKKTQGEDHPDYAMLLGNLAKAQRGKGDLPRAIENAELALAIERKRLGPDHHSTRESEALLAELRASAR